MKFLELRHVEPEGAAAYLGPLEEYGDLTVVRLWRESVPTATDWDAVIVMGGPMGANDGATVAWIDEEIALLRQLLAAGVPVWGVCLGAQLLAAALNAPVWTGETPEVGVRDVSLTDAGRADPVWGDLPTPFPALHWHADSFDLPEGAELLASTEAYTNQVFRHGRSYGVQFHFEADAALAGEWFEIEEYQVALEASLGAGAVEPLLADVAAISDRTAPWAEQVMTRWLDSLA